MEDSPDFYYSGYLGPPNPDCHCPQLTQGTLKHGLSEHTPNCQKDSCFLQQRIGFCLSIFPTASQSAMHSISRYLLFIFMCTEASPSKVHSHRHPGVLAQALNPKTRRWKQEAYILKVSLSQKKDMCSKESRERYMRELRRRKEKGAVL